MKNIIIGQSGGPTAVINSSLAGVYEAAKQLGAEHIYGMRHGIEGFLEGNYIDLKDILTSGLYVEFLKRTPSSFLGTCRYKLPDIEQEDAESVYRRIFDSLQALDIGCVFYIGGNDSMDTINKLSKYACAINSDIRFMGVPKTIDNDLEVTDHTPGYGSAAKYIGVVTKEIIRDAAAYNKKSVTIVEIMGRNAGWLTAASALAKGEDCEGVDMICLPEVEFSVEEFLHKMEDLLKIKKSIVVSVSEGLKLSNGQYVCELSDFVQNVDAFGHRNLTGTARYLSEMVSRGLGVKTRAIELSTLQRCAGHMTSRTDITEAYQVGGAAVKAAAIGHTGEMIAIKRLSNSPYQYITEPHPVSEIANLEKKVPIDWINKKDSMMLPVFLDYARPLIQAELTPMYVEGQPHHICL